MAHGEYEEVPIEWMRVEGDVLRYPCPCGDLFEVAVEEVLKGAVIAECPSCSLTIVVLYDEERLQSFLQQHASASYHSGVVAS